MNESNNSLSSKDVSSTVSLYEPSSTADFVDNLSTKAVYEMDPEDSISRPLSRGSVTSGVSMMATKDGVEGERVKRLGIPQYSLNILNSMAHNQYKKQHNHSHSHVSLTKSHASGATEDSLVYGKFQTLYPDLPSAPPMTLREKMRLLNHDRQLLPSSAINSTDNLDELSTKSTPVRNHGGYPNENENTLSVHGRWGGTSDVVSNASTVGDDVSFSQNMRNLSPAISVSERIAGNK